MKKKVTIPEVVAAKGTDRKMTMVTGYDYTIASIINESQVEIILVGDSLGMVMLGNKGTVGVTIDDMIHHIKPVVKGAPDCLVVGDMPFGAYNNTCEQAVESANRLFMEGGCDCVKMEGGMSTVEKIAAVVKAGIPVVGHIGLTPQTSSMMGGFKVQGKSLDDAKELIENAKAIEKAGAFMIVVEGVPTSVGKKITESISIPTMGIGAGIHCDFQNLILQDMLGMFSDFVPKFVKKYANVRGVMVDAFNEFSNEVTAKEFPTPEYSYNTVVEGIEEL